MEAYIENVGFRPRHVRWRSRRSGRHRNRWRLACRGARASLTTIYFLLTDDAVSRWHAVSSDEVWHLYEGWPLELFDLDLEARVLDVRRPADVEESDVRPVHVIQAARWQAARSLGPYALVGCTVAPGFEFQDFRLMSDDAVAASVVGELRPELAKLI